MATTFEKLFQDADDGALLDALASAIEDVELNRKTIRPEWRHVLRAWQAAGRISNGGFECFFQDELLDVDQTIAAFEAIGAKEAIKLVRRACSVFPGGKPPEDVDRRMELIEKLTGKRRETFECDGAAVYDEGILPPLADYVRARRDLFRDLGDDAPYSFFPSPPRKEAPPPAASARDVARWIQSLEGTVAFQESKHPNGLRKLHLWNETLPEGTLTLADIHLDGGRRDHDPVLATLASGPCAGTIEEIDLEDGRLGREGFEALRRFPRLAALNLSGSTADDAALEVLGEIKSLRRINLEGTKVNGASLGRLRNLKRLVIGRGPFRDRALSFLAGLTSIEELEVHGLRLLPAALKAVASRRRLKRLLLWDTGLKESALGALKRHGALASLYLQGMRLTARGAETLLAIPKLKKLSIGDGKLAPEAREVLRKSRPSLVVE